MLTEHLGSTKRASDLSLKGESPRPTRELLDAADEATLSASFRSVDKRVQDEKSKIDGLEKNLIKIRKTIHAIKQNSFHLDVVFNVLTEGRQTLEAVKEALQSDPKEDANKCEKQAKTELTPPEEIEKEIKRVEEEYQKMLAPYEKVLDELCKEELGLIKIINLELQTSDHDGKKGPSIERESDDCQNHLDILARLKSMKAETKLKIEKARLEITKAYSDLESVYVSEEQAHPTINHRLLEAKYRVPFLHKPLEGFPKEFLEKAKAYRLTKDVRFIITLKEYCDIYGVDSSKVTPEFLREEKQLSKSNLMILTESYRLNENYLNKVCDLIVETAEDAPDKETQESDALPAISNKKADFLKKIREKVLKNPELYDLGNVKDELHKNLIQLGSDILVARQKTDLLNQLCNTIAKDRQDINPLVI